MKIDWNELQKGAEEEIGKTSIQKEAGLAGALGKLLARGFVRVAPGTAAAGVKYLPEVAKVLPGGIPGKIALTAAATGAVPAVTERVAPEYHKQLLENSQIYSAANDAKKMVGDLPQTAQDTWDTTKALFGAGKALKDTTDEAVKTVNNVSSVFGGEQPDPEGSFVKNLGTATRNGKRFLEGGGDLAKQFNTFYNTTREGITNAYNSANTGLTSLLSGLGDYGKYLPLGLGLLGGGLGGYLLSGRNNKSREAAPGPVVNINLGGRRGRLLDYDPSGVGSLSSIKTGSISDALASAAGRRIADKVLNKAVGEPVVAPVVETDPRAVELTSKHPEIVEMLKNEQTKAYLEKLLKE